MTFELTPQGFGVRSLMPALGGFGLLAALGTKANLSSRPVAIAFSSVVLVVAVIVRRAGVELNLGPAAC